MTQSTNHPINQQPGLVRELRLPDVVAIVVGVVIGSGIFLVPSDIARSLASPAHALLVWIVGGLLTLFGALSLAELAAMAPGAGGFYTILRAAYGDRAGFLYTWSFLLLINTGSLATLAVAFGIYAAQLVPLSAVGQKVVAVAVLLLLTWVNCLGVRAGKWVQNIFTLAKLSGIAILCGIVFWHRAPFAAVAAADGFSRATGEVVATSGTEGPGFTNMIMNIAAANAARTPLLVLACPLISPTTSAACVRARANERP